MRFCSRKTAECYTICVVMAFILLFALHAPFSSAFPSYDADVIMNSNDWRNVFLGTMYSATIKADFFYFDNLQDANVKSQTIPKSDKIIILEPEENPIVKDYSMYLKVNGWDDYTTIKFKDYSDLQQKLWRTGKYVLLDPSYGIEAIAASPYITKEGYTPLFLTEENKEQVAKIVGNSEVLVVGHFPVRVIAGFKGKGFTSYPDENTLNITRLYFSKYPSEWGVITKADRIFPSTLKRDMPIFVYYGDINALAEVIGESNAQKFEVISGDMASIASEVETLIGKDLKFMMMFGRTVTNIPGMEGRILDVDTVYFDFPNLNLEIVRSEFYPKMNITAITFRNRGNILALFFSNLELAGTAFSDLNVHSAAQSSEITIPFKSNIEFSPGARSILTTQYGYKMPLGSMLQSERGDSFVRLNITVNELYDTSAISLEDYMYNDREGNIILKISNNNDKEVNVFAEFIKEDNIALSSPTTKIRPKSDGEVIIPTPYTVWDEIKGRNYTVKFYYGEKDTILEKDYNIEITKVITEERLEIDWLAVSIIVIVVILVVLAFIFGKKRRRKHHHG